MRQAQIEAVLGRMRDLHPELMHKCLNGSCFKLFLLLRVIWPDAEAWYDGDHVLTLLDGQFWDVRGCVEPGRHIKMEGSDFNSAYLWGQELEEPLYGQRKES